MGKVSKKYFQEQTLIGAEYGRSLVAPTMTAKGGYVSLYRGPKTNDGVTIIQHISIKDPIRAQGLDALKQSARKTEIESGDGTSASVIMTESLLRAVYKIDKPFFAIEKILDDFEAEVIKSIDDATQKLETKEDFVNLAKVSVKHDALGEMIGGVVYDAGDNGTLEIKESSEKKDMIKKKEGYQVLGMSTWQGLPTQLENANVVLVNGPIINPTNELAILAQYAVDTEEPLAIVVDEIGEAAARFINGFNAQNNTEITMLNVPNGRGTMKVNLVFEDLSMFINARVLTPETIASGNIKDVTGKVGKVGVGKGMTLFFEPAKSAKSDQITKLEKELKPLLVENIHSVVTPLKDRISMLKGSAFEIHIHAPTMQEKETKLLRVQDAVKSIFLTKDIGYVPGAGSVYMNAYRKLKDNKEFAELTPTLLEVAKQAYSIIGKKFVLPSKEGHSINVFTGEVVDVAKDGIIDSASVSKSVIVNSISAVKSLASIFAAEVPEDYEDLDNG